MESGSSKTKGDSKTYGKWDRETPIYSIDPSKQKRNPTSPDLRAVGEGGEERARRETAVSSSFEVGRRVVGDPQGLSHGFWGAANRTA